MRDAIIARASRQDGRRFACRFLSSSSPGLMLRGWMDFERIILELKQPKQMTHSLDYSNADSRINRNPRNPLYVRAKANEFCSAPKMITSFAGLVMKVSSSEFCRSFSAERRISLFACKALIEFEDVDGHVQLTRSIRCITGGRLRNAIPHSFLSPRRAYCRNDRRDENVSHSRIIFASI